MTELMRIDLATLRNEHREAVAQRELAWDKFVSTHMLKIVHSLNEQFLANLGKGDSLVATINLEEITGNDDSQPFVVRFTTDFNASPPKYLDGYMGDAGYNVKPLGGNLSKIYTVTVLMDNREWEVRLGCPIG